MSALAIFYVGAGALVVAAGIGGTWLARRAAATAEAPPMDWGQDPDDRRWDDEAADALHAQLADVRSAARAWAAAISALLGVFSVVAFVKGPTEFTAVRGREGTAAALLVLLAAALAAGSVLLAALAGQGTPRHLAQLDGWELRFQTTTRARIAAAQLSWSRLLAISASLVVIFSVGLTWLAARATPPHRAASMFLILGNDGSLRCGSLSASGRQLRLQPGPGVFSIAHARSITPVAACPPRS